LFEASDGTQGRHCQFVPSVAALRVSAPAKKSELLSAGTVYFKGCVWNSVEQIMPKQYEGVLARNPPAAWPRRGKALASYLSFVR
jgi:hypothetical protein